MGEDHAGCRRSRAALPVAAAVTTGALVLTGVLIAHLGPRPESAGSGPAVGATAYAGPLVVTPTAGAAPSDAGAAAVALECTGEPGGGAPTWADTAMSTKWSQGRALADVDQWYGWWVPTHRWVQLRASVDRALYAVEFDGRRKAAVVLRRGKPAGSVRRGWKPESIAWCDRSEFSPDSDSDPGVQVWTDVAGHRMPTTQVVSYTGPVHCDWTSVTFLHVGEREFVRDPEHLLTSSTKGTFAASTALPASAQDTGLSRDRGRLWVDEDAAYVVRASGAKRWPATRRPVGCT